MLQATDKSAMKALAPFQPRRGLFGRPSPVAGQGVLAKMQESGAGQGVMPGNQPGIEIVGKPIPNTRPLLEAQETAPNHWTVGGFDQLRAKGPMPPAMPQATPSPNGGPLGGSMRQPFDYDGALATLRGDQKKIPAWQKVAAILGDGLTTAGGGQGFATQALLGREREMSERNQAATQQLMEWRYKDWQRQNEADLKAANPFTIGRDRVGYDPATGQASVLYDGAEDFELYANELGLQPGSEDYFRAVEDYVLRGSGPSAHVRDMEIDDYRTGNDAELEGLRQTNRTSLENLRQGNRRSMEGYRQGNRETLRRMPQVRSQGSSPSRPVSVKTPAEAQALPRGTRYKTPDGQVYTR